MITKVLVITVLIAYAIVIVVTANLYDAKEMKRRFVDGQCAVGKVFTNLFYAPAWFLKLLRFVVVKTVR